VSKDMSWIVEGAEVVVYSYGGGIRPAWAKATTITRVTPKTFSVESDEQRFSRDTASRRNGEWEPNTCVVPITDPKASVLLREELSRGRERKAKAIVTAWQGDTGPENTERVIKAMRALQVDREELDGIRSAYKAAQEA
jgi:hypothetical protein